MNEYGWTRITKDPSSWPASEPQRSIIVLDADRHPCDHLWWAHALRGHAEAGKNMGYYWMPRPESVHGLVEQAVRKVLYASKQDINMVTQTIVDRLKESGVLS